MTEENQREEQEKEGKSESKSKSQKKKKYIWEGSFVNRYQGGPDLSKVYEIFTRMSGIKTSLRQSIYENQDILKIETERKDDMKVALSVLQAFGYIESVPKEMHYHRFD